MRLAVLASWRATKGIYRFDPILQEELWNTPIKGDIPADLLLRLPAWCVYVDVGREAVIPDFKMANDYLHGFFASLDYNTQTGQAELALLLVYESPPEFYIRTPLTGTVEESIAAQFRLVKKTLLKYEGSLNGCKFRFITITESDSSRSPVPGIAITRSEASRSPIPGIAIT